MDRPPPERLRGAAEDACPKYIEPRMHTNAGDVAPGRASVIDP